MLLALTGRYFRGTVIDFLSDIMEFGQINSAFCVVNMFQDNFSIYLLHLYIYVCRLSVSELFLYAIVLSVLYFTMKIQYGVPNATYATLTDFELWSGIIPNGVPSVWIQFLCYAGFSMNLSWVVLASTLNFILSGLGAELKIVLNVNISIAIIFVLTIIAALMIILRLDIPYGMVVSWALAGIAREQNNNPSVYSNRDKVVMVTYLCQGVLLLSLITTITVHCMKKLNKSSQNPLLSELN